MSEIIQLVEAAFAAKRTHGPNSNEFKAAQMAVFEKIDQTYQVGADDLVLVETSSVLKAPIKIRVHKKGSGSKYCGFVLEEIQ